MRSDRTRITFHPNSKTKATSRREDINGTTDADRINTPHTKASRTQNRQRSKIDLNRFPDKHPKSHQEGRGAQAGRHIINEHPDIRQRRYGLGSVGSRFDRYNKLIHRESETGTGRHHAKTLFRGESGRKLEIRKLPDLPVPTPFIPHMKFIQEGL